MNKILNYIFVFFLFALIGCAYEPILKSKNYQFSINLEQINGESKINSIITNKFNKLKGNKKYDITLSSNKEKKNNI